MPRPCRSLSLAIVLLILCVVEWSKCLNVEVFVGENYGESLGKITINKEQELNCFTLEHKIQGYFQSIKTDKCVILYTGEDCEGRGEIREVGSVRFDKDVPSGLGFVFTNYIRSLHVCSQKLGGGPQLDLDFYDNPQHRSEGHLASYKGVCDCRNVDPWVIGGKTKTISLDNHGNSLYLYGQENCQGESEHILAGDNHGSRFIEDYSWDVKSFRPADLKNCYRLTASIHKLDFQNKTTSIDDLGLESRQVNIDSTVLNSKTEVTIHTHKVSSDLYEKIEFSVAEPFTKLETVEVDPNLLLEAEGNEVPVVTRKSANERIAATYHWSSTNDDQANNVHKLRITSPIEIEQQIQIPPCKECAVKTSLEKVKRFPVKYVAYAKISAANDAEQLNTEELKKNLPAGIDYVRDVDEHTVEGVTEGTMFLEFGLKVVVTVDCDGHIIHGCNPSVSNGKIDHQVYESPIRVVEQ